MSTARASLISAVVCAVALAACGGKDPIDSGKAAGAAGTGGAGPDAAAGTTGLSSGVAGNLGLHDHGNGPLAGACGRYFNSDFA